MKISTIERYEEHTVLLELNKDFTEADLIPNRLVGGRVFSIKANVLTDIAINNGYIGWSFNGHYNSETKTAVVKFKKNLYIDPKNV